MSYMQTEEARQEFMESPQRRVLIEQVITVTAESRVNLDAEETLHEVNRRFDELWTMSWLGVEETVIEATLRTRAKLERDSD